MGDIMTENEKIKFKVQLIIHGGSKGINIPKELLEFLDIIEKDELVIIPDIGKKGKFIAIFKEEVKQL